MKHPLIAFALPLLLAGCAAAQPTDEMAVTREMPLEYAEQFTVGYTAEDCALVTIGGEQKFLVVPQDADTPQNVPADVTVLHSPVENIYLVSSSQMDFFDALDAVDSITLSGQKAENWYIDSARAAMQAGRMAYAGKYSAPDYEQILAAQCGLAVENTMIYHTPEVKEELERFGIPVLVERSSYESGPLARMEWIKLYGVLLGKTQQAEQLFADTVQALQPVLEQQPSGTTAAFFSITSNGLATVRKGGDYVAQMIAMAGGEYVFAGLTDSGSNLSTMNLPLEEFYATAKEADVLIYNSTIEGTIETTAQLLDKCPILADCKAVQNGRVYCTSQSMFQQTMELGDMILDMHTVFTQQDPDASELHYLTKVQ